MRLPRLITGAAVAIALLGVAVNNTASAQSNQQYSAANIQAGYRLYSSQCALCHGNNGDTIAGVNLPHQQFRRASSDADIGNTITNGVPAAGMPPFQLRPAEIDSLIAYIRSGFDISGIPFTVGDATRGKAVYDRSGCAVCHRVHGNGSLAAPDLSDIAMLRKPAVIQLSILQPSTAMQSINRPVHIVMRDGRTIDGRRLNEDTETVQLTDREGRLLSLSKSDIRDYQIANTSQMPSYSGRLSSAEAADLLAYLLTLKG